MIKFEPISSQRKTAKLLSAPQDCDEREAERAICLGSPRALTKDKRAGAIINAQP
jgi:hypothetical protein